MKRFLISTLMALALGLGLAGASVSAGAATVTPETDGSPYPSFKNSAGDTHKGVTVNDPLSFTAFHKFKSYNDTFVDKYKFTIADITSLTFDVTSTNHVIKLNFQLLGTTDGIHYTDLGFMQSGFASTYGHTNEQSFTFTGALLNILLSQQSIIMKITGVMCDCASYSITVSGTAAVTPVPPALLLFITAIAGMGGAGFMRRRKAAGARLAA
jgi:hypothetical protein